MAIPGDGFRSRTRQPTGRVRGRDQHAGDSAGVRTSGFPNPPGDSYFEFCMKPESAIACDQDGDWYVFTRCEESGPFVVSRYAVTAVGPIPTPISTFGSFTAPRYLAATL